MREEALVLRVVTLLAVVLAGAACSSVLPRAQEETLSPWETFEEARTSFEKIEPGITTVDELAKLGFDPDATPNITRITYIDLLSRFLPNQSIRLDDIDPGVSQCLGVREACYGLQVTPGLMDRKRFGNAFLDVFGFKRRTRVTGWRFDGLIVIEHDRVIYTLAGGDSNINRLESIKRPLGPLQEIDIRGAVELNN